MKNFDFISIGDIVIDIFIELETAHIGCDIDVKNCKISMPWGTKIPFKNATIIPGVGNSPNASVSTSRLGLSSSIITSVGKDNWGDECIKRLKEENVDTSNTTTNDLVPTNVHYVLSYKSERTILIKHNKFEYVDPIFEKPPKYLYISSIASYAFPYHQKILDNISPQTKLIFQPGTYQILAGKKKLADFYKRTDVFTCNVQEAKKILEQDEKIENLLKNMHNIGPKIVCITDGPKGAYVYDGNEIWYAPSYPDIAPPVERTGAGDAFTSTFAAFLSFGLSPKEALLRAPINSMSVVQHVGAQKGLLTKDKIEKYLAEAPKEYKLKKL